MTTIGPPNGGGETESTSQNDSESPFRETILHWIRFHARQSDTPYKNSSWCGSDGITGERYRLVAAALRRIYAGESLDAALAWYGEQWASFAREMNAKVNAAPKLKYGPCSGQSIISHKAVTPSNGDQGELDIRRHCWVASEAQRVWDASHTDSREDPEVRAESDRELEDWEEI